jgi:hypothetical protein
MELDTDLDWFRIKEDVCVVSDYWRKTARELDELDAIIISKLEEGPMSVPDMTKLFQQHAVVNPEATGKSAAWRLVEIGKAIFNDEWLLELNKIKED